METIGMIFSGYLQGLTSWWWFAFAMVTFIWMAETAIRENDCELSHAHTFKLILVGLATLVPSFAKVCVSQKLSEEFASLWAVYPLDEWQTFVLRFGLLCFFLGPIAFVLFAFLLIGGRITSGAFAHDVVRHGWMKALKYKWQQINEYS